MTEELIGAAALTSRYVVAFVFLTAAIPKLVEQREFERAVRNYALVPELTVPAIATWLPRLELVCALALLLGVGVSLFAGIAAVLLLAFAAAIAVNLMRGRSIECGCRGSVASRRIGWGLVAGDIFLAGMAAMAALLAPGTLSLLAASDTPIGASDGVAFLIVAGVLVVGWLTITSARERASASHRVETRLESRR